MSHSLCHECTACVMLTVTFMFKTQLLFIYYATGAAQRNRQTYKKYMYCMCDTDSKWHVKNTHLIQVAYLSLLQANNSVVVHKTVTVYF